MSLYDLMALKTLDDRLLALASFCYFLMLLFFGACFSIALVRFVFRSEVKK